MEAKATIDSWQPVVSPADPNRPRPDGTWETNAWVAPEYHCLLIQGRIGNEGVTTSAVREVHVVGDELFVVTRNSTYRLGHQRSIFTRDISDVLDEHPYLKITVNNDAAARRSPNIRRSGRDRRYRTTWKPMA